MTRSKASPASISFLIAGLSAHLTATFNPVAASNRGRRARTAGRTAMALKSRISPLMAEPPFSPQPLQCRTHSAMRRIISLQHQRPRRLACLVRMAGIEERRRIIFDAELDRPRHIGAGEFRNDGKGEVD